MVAQAHGAGEAHRGEVMTGIRGDRLSDSTWQAEAFLGWFRRLPPTEDRMGGFARWGRSKGFGRKDTRQIADEVARLSGSQGWTGRSR